MNVNSVLVSFKINNCGECRHVQPLHNFNYTICGHPENKRIKENKKCSINNMVDPPMFNPGVPDWCPLIAGCSYKNQPIQG